MNDVNYLQAVREQYENYPYPNVDPQLEKTRLYLPITETFDRMNDICFGGKMNFTKGFRTLIAGGGTGDAAVFLAEQLRDTDADIIYVDISQASMAVAKERARLRGLTNITWIHDSLLNIPKLGLGTFDYINSSGVLHHLANPDEGLHALSSVLKEDGAMGLMLYAKYGRLAVYQMQEALRILNRGEENLQTQVDNAKEVLNYIPATNWFLNSPPVILAEIQQGDAAIFDLLLHSQDRSYSIPELYDFLGGAGLNLLHLFAEDPSIGIRLYNPANYLKNTDLIRKARALPLRDQQTLAELLNGKIAKHTLYAAKKIPTPLDMNDLENIPLLGFDIYSQRNAICEVVRTAQEGVVALRQPSTNVVVVLQQTPHMELLFKYIDGKLSLKEIFRKIMDVSPHKDPKPNYQTLQAEFLEIYRALNDVYWMFLRAPTSSYIRYYDVLQGHMKMRHEVG